MGRNRESVARQSDERAYLAAARLRIQLLTFQRRTEEITGHHGFTPERYLLLLLVHTDAIRGEPSTVSALCEPLQLTQSSVSRLVAGAVRAGLLRRERDSSDHRRGYLHLTRTGTTRLQAAFNELGPERDELAAVLSDTALTR